MSRYVFRAQARSHKHACESYDPRFYNTLMNPALLFVIFIVVLAVLVTWWLLRALKRDRLRDTPNTRATNVEALRIERAELERDQKLGLMNEASFNEAMRELEVRVLRESELDRATPHVKAGARSMFATASFATLFPLAAIGMYFLLGAPHAVIPEVVRPEAAKQESQMEELFRVAEEKLKAQPDDAKGWYLLARAKASLGRFDDAMKDYATLLKLTPNDADAWADYADAAAGAAEGKMAGKPLELVNKALAIDAKQPKALLLRGTHEMQINDLNAAEKSFTAAKSVSDPQTGFAQIAENALKDIAVRRAGAGPGATVASGGAQAATASSSASAAAAPTLISVKLALSDEAMKAAASTKDAAIFVIIRAADAPTGPPLAVKKIAPNAASSPVEFSASDAMIGGAGLSPGRDVAMEARLSLSGQPRAQAGDFSSGRSTFALNSDGKVVAKSITIFEKMAQ